MIEKLNEAQAYFDARVNKVLSLKDMAQMLCISYGTAQNLANELCYRLEPPEGKDRIILPGDGLPPPLAASETRNEQKLPYNASLKTSSFPVSNRKMFLDEYEDDAGSR